MAEVHAPPPSADEALPADEADAEGSDTAIDESQIIALVRALLPGDAAARESAGALLWDLSIIRGVAITMVELGMIYEVLKACLTVDLSSAEGCQPGQADPARPVEIALGLLGNIVAHTGLSHSLSQQIELLDLVTGPGLHAVDSTPALSELCRLASTALRKPGYQAWMRRLSGPEACERLLWIIKTSPDPLLHARCLDLIVALLAAEQGSSAPASPQRDAPASDAQHSADNQGASTIDDGSQAAERTSSCASALLAAGLLPLIKQLLQQAGNQLEGDSSSGWAGFNPLPSYTPAASCARGSVTRPASTARAPNTWTPQHAQQAPMPLSELSIDATLRLLEVLGALPDEHPHKSALLADTQLAGQVVRLLHCCPGEQVLESLLLVIQALGSSAVQVLASSLSNVSMLMNCLGELPSGEKGAWQRELVLYTLARVLKQAAAAITDAALPASGHGSPAQESDSTQPPAASAEAQASLVCSVSEDWHDTKALIEFSDRVSSLPDTCAVSGSHITGYIRLMARSMLVVLSKHSTNQASSRVRDACLKLEEALTRSCTD